MVRCLWNFLLLEPNSWNFFHSTVNLISPFLPAQCISLITFLCLCCFFSWYRRHDLLHNFIKVWCDFLVLIDKWSDERFCQIVISARLKYIAKIKLSSSLIKKCHCILVICAGLLKRKQNFLIVDAAEHNLYWISIRLFIQ